MQSFRAFRIHQEAGKIVSRMETIGLNDLAEGEVVVKVRYSTINYKDALAATGAGKILRRYPLVGGIDLAGEVVSSSDPQFQPGQKVLVTGSELSETRDGGYAEYARLKSDSVVPIPSGLDEFQAMAIGTAGYTAALAVHRMEQNGQQPDGGDIVVTGATGGVGSIAVDMLAARGYSVVAVTGKQSSVDYLQRLGAARVLLRDQINTGSRPLEEAQFAGAIDNVGGELLTWLTRTVKFWGNIASIGLAASPELKTTVMPFILRGVSLLGINSVYTPRPLRLQVWQRLATDLKPRHLDSIVTRTIAFEQLPGAFDGYLQAGVTGRTVVRIAG
ncbi:putative quinone oxidoreductase YhfP [Steroidobacter agaridevorans]|uniref:Putative quinone oxidoreductase YhfP n=1 Tax=Steroidobacter agaridevorans TaxID=2695856 RepID=A0A829Y5A7_9GAMM|nr:oxidoreductase [Steroidobacter agaridevorans]GFE78400.1 putative quinone oxidoreductase YhfP [Steroidobacter agaridevorans]